jgi:hypothetical protein
MRPVDNRDSTILIFSDYLEETGLEEEAEEIRKQARSPPNNSWYYEYRTVAAVGGIGEGTVGSDGTSTVSGGFIGVGGNIGGFVGGVMGGFGRNSVSNAGSDI